MSNTVLLTIQDHIATVTLNRPEKRNAVDWTVLDGLTQAGETLKARADIRAVILTGAGPTFCSGIDTSLFMANPDPKALIDQILTVPEGQSANKFQKPCTVWQELEIPVIAAVQGVCYGAGLQIALGADIRIGAPDARLSVMEIAWGLIPDMGLTTVLPRLMRADQAKELILTGRIVDAAEAAQQGLLTRVAENPAAEALDLARRIAGHNPDAIRRNKRLVNDTWHASRPDALRLEAELQAQVIGQPNQLEAVFARIQKRKPRFS